MIDERIAEDGNEEIYIYDSKGDVIDNPEFGFGVRGLMEFTFFRESSDWFIERQSDGNPLAGAHFDEEVKG